MTIQGTKISMTRGDSETLTVSLANDAFAPGDEVFFTVRPAVAEPVALQKTVTDFPGGRAVITIEPGDTAGLDFGRYVYDIQLTRASGAVTTLIKPAAFVLTEEVTY